MKYDYKFSGREIAVLKSKIGERLESYRLNDTDNTSFEIFVLRFPGTDVELATKEICGTDDWFDDTNTVEVEERPNRDSWSRVGKSEPDNGIPEGEFMDYDVGKIVTGVSVVIETFSSGADAGEFVRGIVIDLGSESVVFDKGALNWESIWRVRRCPVSDIDLPHAEFDLVEEPELSSRTRIERVA